MAASTAGCGVTSRPCRAETEGAVCSISRTAHPREDATNTERTNTPIERLIACYDPAFRRTMTVSADELRDAEALGAAIERLEPEARDLADTLLVGVGAGEVVPQRLFRLVDASGEPLWRMAFLLPVAAPSVGATIDPRYYAAACRINPALASLRPLPHTRTDAELAAHAPASDAQWDAIVVAALLENQPAVVTQQGRLRKDVERRLLRSLGEDEDRWTLALDQARATGLVREAAGRLFGRPESGARRLNLTDPRVLFDDDRALAAGALLRLVDSRWLPLDVLMEELGRRCPDVLFSEHDRPFDAREGALFRQAANVLHRAGLLDAHRGPLGIVAVRTATPKPPRPSGFFLTPDREILVAPGELPPAEYGRLCRLAPYVGGDVVHRHRLTREGVAADIAAGYDGVVEWIARYSRTGLPPSVRSTVELWAASAVRLTLVSNITLIERDGRFSIWPAPPPPEARVLHYDERVPARFYAHDGVLYVPFGEDALTVRAVIDRVGERLPPEANRHRWRLAPRDVRDPDRLLDQLRRYHEGPLPGDVEAAVQAAGGRVHCWIEEAVVIHLPPEATDALRRDPVAAPLLIRLVGEGQCLVDRRRLPTLEARLTALGFRLGPSPDVIGSDER